jgi:peptide/nickel transport system substrate-binding protein
VRRFPPVAGLVLLLACSSAPRRANTVILASGADLQSANPLLTTHSLARQVQRYALLVTLVQHDTTLTPIPYLARTWQWSADSATITMRIFSGLSWHDGVPTTARDAAWTLEAARDPVTGYPRQNDLVTLRSASAPDDTTLVLRFSRPVSRLPDLLTDLAMLPAHLLGTVPRAELRRAAWNQSPVGNGPFRFVAHEANRRWIFAANPDFPAGLGGPPRLDRFVVAVVDEPTTKLAALTSGELDLAGINPAHAEFVRRNPRLRVLDYPLLFSYTLLFNTRRPPFNELAVRRALDRAIDRRAIGDGVLFGFGTPAESPVPPALETGRREDGTTGRREDGTTGEGWLRDRGIRFEILTVGSGEAALEQMLQSQLAGLGVRAEIRQLELSTYLERVERAPHDFDTAVLGVSGDLGLGHLARLLALAGLRPEGAGEKLVEQIRDSVPMAFLYHARGVQGINRRVQGIHMDLRGELVTLSQWWVKDDER